MKCRSSVSQTKHTIPEELRAEVANQQIKKCDKIYKSTCFVSFLAQSTRVYVNTMSRRKNISNDLD